MNVCNNDVLGNYNCDRSHDVVNIPENPPVYACNIWILCEYTLIKKIEINIPNQVIGYKSIF